MSNEKIALCIFGIVGGLIALLTLSYFLSEMSSDVLRGIFKYQYISHGNAFLLLCLFALYKAGSIWLDRKFLRK